MVKSFATVVLSTAITLLWLNWSMGVQFILLVFIGGSMMLHFFLCARVVRQKFRELASADVTARRCRAIHAQLMRAVA